MTLPPNIVCVQNISIKGNDLTVVKIKFPRDLGYTEAQFNCSVRRVSELHDLADIHITL